MKIIRRSEFTSVPWKNQGGVTHEIAKQENDQNILWRLSIAEVTQNGAFSIFDGLQRSLTVIAGSGMDLLGASGNLVHEAPLLQPITFSGCDALVGVLRNGPCQDFNLIFDPKIFEGSVDIIDIEDDTIDLTPSDFSTGLLCLGDTMNCGGQILNHHDFAFLSPTDRTVKLSSSSKVLRVTLRQL